MIRGKEYRETLKGRKIMVVGLGKSGKAAVKALEGLGAIVTAQDSSPAEKIDPDFLGYMESNGICAILGKAPDEVTGFDMLVLSPGVPVSLGYITAARDAGAEIIGELELAYRISECRFAAITGTNGKTTTTTLTGEIFKAAGLKTYVVGNIGNPVVTEAMTSDKEDWMVAEVSSFQLETTEYFKPEVSAILNLTPDHLNRHKTMEAYGNAKARVAVNQTQNEFLVINDSDEAVIGLSAQSRAHIIPFSRTKELSEGAFIRDGRIVIKDFGGSEFDICGLSDIKIIGDHNVENVLAAAAIAHSAGIDRETIGKAISDFGGVEHRIEFCGNVDGVDYYNDSKGTNVDAAVIAIKALRENIVLIAGGDGKSQDFTDLAAHLDGAVKALVLLGRDAGIIEEAARKAGFDNIYNCKNMEECVLKASELAARGDRVLLSPACASWDMYPNFEERGKHFKQCVRNCLEEKQQ